MTTQLYLVPLPDSQTTRPPSQAVRSRVDVSGILEEGGIATEAIATEGVDLTIRGQIRLGPTFSKKVADELDSLGESSYSGIALYDESQSALGDRRGYYEIRDVDVNPAHKATSDAFEYTATLDKTGTRETHWRAVELSEVDVGTNLATGSSGLLGVPSDDRKERWYSVASGFESANPTSTVSGEYGDIDLFDPSNSSFSDPVLLFEQPYGAEGSTDVRVWDDNGSDKFATFSDGSGGSIDITQWTHAFHPGFEYEGTPLVDNGLIRLRFDEGNSVLEAWEWDDSNSAWSSISITHGDWELFDADVEQIAPASVDVFAEFEDTQSGDIHAARLSIQRGISRAVVRNPQNDTIPSGLETVLDPVASDQTTDLQPEQTLLSRGEVK